MGLPVGAAPAVTTIGVEFLAVVDEINDEDEKRNDVVGVIKKIPEDVVGDVVIEDLDVPVGGKPKNEDDVLAREDEELLVGRRLDEDSVELLLLIRDVDPRLDELLVVGRRLDDDSMKLLLVLRDVELLLELRDDDRVEELLLVIRMLDDGNGNGNGNNEVLVLRDVDEEVDDRLVLVATLVLVDTMGQTVVLTAITAVVRIVLWAGQAVTEALQLMMVLVVVRKTVLVVYFDFKLATYASMQCLVYTISYQGALGGDHDRQKKLDGDGWLHLESHRQD
jgi:hypothetical protein